MKFFLLFLLIVAGPARSHEAPIWDVGGTNPYATQDLKRRRGELKPPPKIHDFKELNRVLFNDLQNQNDDLKLVKYYLLNGETRLAKAKLTRIAYTQTSLKPVIHRYLAILSFIESDFQKTYDYLSIPELQSIPQFSKICVLKVLSQIVLNKLPTLEKNWTRCQLENYNKFREENLVWLETLLQLKLNPEPGMTEVPFRRLYLAALELEDLKMMMKLALYLNQEEMLVKQIPSLEVAQLQDPEIRELAGQALFRTGSLARAYKFVEDLKSPNAENIKGNLYLLRNKFELAYAQFKLALEQKNNSQNAMERLLPLAWLLKDWDGGSKYAEQVIASPQTQINKLTLMAAFLMQKGEYEKTNQILKSIAQTSRRGTEIEVTQLAAFTGLMQNKPAVIKKQSLMNCEQYDLVSCWVLFQMIQWEAFPLTVRRDEEVPQKKIWEKLVKDDLNQPLKETVYVNQLDIEEMDDKLIQLIPGT